MDPFDLMSSSMAMTASWLKDPWGNATRLFELCSGLNEAATGEVHRFLSSRDGGNDSGRLAQDVLEYSRIAASLARKSYSLYSTYVRNWVAATDDLDPKEKKALSFWVDQHLKALAPANFFWTNPIAVKKCIDTRGESLNSGFRNWMKDVERKDLSIQGCDMDAFKVGENLATTAGAVVYRNHLVEVIQYPAAGPKAYAVPIVFITPWINKYYILDLDEQKSFVRYLSQQGFTTFITSWKNPTPDMRGVTFEDYVRDGALKAIEVARDICRSKTVHAAGYCIGGTALSALMAALNKADPDALPVVDFTLFSTLVDFEDTGSLGVFVSEKTIQLVECLTQRDGYLDGRYTGMVFNTLKSDSQIWWHYARNYLQGETPSPSDFLFWNHDRTRLPAAMASFYLRELCLRNQLVQPDRLTLCGQPIDLGRIRQPLYAVCGVEDHICLWKGTFAVCSKVGGPVRYVLADGGHITGIVNPPSTTSKKKFRAGDASGAVDADRWLAGAPSQVGSWWEDWVKWLLVRSPAKKVAHSLGNKEYPAQGKAPGQYVFEK
jgi:polyhydroxyalkanoate synthase